MLLIVNHKLGLSSEKNIGYPLSVHNYILNDEWISKAKEIAKEAGISEFNVVQQGEKRQDRNPIYFGVVTK